MNMDTMGIKDLNEYCRTNDLSVEINKKQRLINKVTKNNYPNGF